MLLAEQAPFYENDSWDVRESRDLQLVVVRRKPGVRMQADRVASYITAFEQLIRPDHRRFTVIVDTREAVGNNDPDFERATRSLQQLTERAFGLTVVLVRTQAGALQVQRMAAGRADFFVTSSETQALAYAASHRASAQREAGQREPGQREEALPTRRDLLRLRS